MARIRRLSCILVLFLGIMSVTALLQSAALAAAADGAACAQNKGAFDGIAPLQYFQVDGASRIYLYPKHPSLCESADAEGCGAKAYVVPKDLVAVSSTCGSWAYVQYIGKKLISYGWIKTSELGQPLRNSDSSKTQSVAALQNEDATWYHFTLVKGQGLPVCEAYQQRLNRTQYEVPPYCGRPEDDSVPGFSKLNRVPLPISDVNRLIGRIANFSHPLSRAPDQVWVIQPDGTKKLQSKWPAYSEGTKLPIWQYSPPVDIENSGRPDNIVVWQAQDGPPFCGDEFGRAERRARSPQIAYVLTQGNKDIDVAATQSIFGRPGGYRIHDPDGHDVVLDGFEAIGDWISIFEYRGQYYFDTFYPAGLDLNEQHVNRNALGLFFHQDGSTQELCRYQMTSNNSDDNDTGRK